MIKEYAVQLIVCDNNEEELYKKLCEQYKLLEEVDIVCSTRISDVSSADVFVLVGDNDDCHIVVESRGIPIVDLRDKKLQHLVKDSIGFDVVRKIIIDGLVAPYLDSLIGLDISEIVNLIGNSKKIYIGISASNNAQNTKELISNVIESVDVNMSKCSGIYLNISGDIDMLQGNEIAKGLQEAVGQDVNIVWSMIYDAKAPEDEYYMTVLFME